MEKALFWQGAGRKISTSVLLNSCHFCRNQGICPRHFEQILLFLKNLFKQRNWFLRYLDRQDLTKSCPDGESRGSLTQLERAYKSTPSKCTLSNVRCMTFKQLEVDTTSYGITWYFHSTTTSCFQHRTYHSSLFYT